MQAMQVEEALGHADEWIEGVTLYEGAQGWRVACATLAAEVRRLRGALEQANDNAERFEREWYLRGDALEAVADLAGWHTDDEADQDDTSPDDMVAHTNGLIRQLCKAVLMGPNDTGNGPRQAQLAEGPR